MLKVFSVAALIFHHEKMSSAVSCQPLLKLMLRISFYNNKWNAVVSLLKHLLISLSKLQCRQCIILFTKPIWWKVLLHTSQYSVPTISHDTGVEPLVVQVHVLNGVSMRVTMPSTLRRKCPDYSIYIHSTTNIYFGDLRQLKNNIKMHLRFQQVFLK